jgi:hypothetical protein
MTSMQNKLESRAFMTGFDAVVAESVMNPFAGVDDIMRNIGVLPNFDGSSNMTFQTKEGIQKFRDGAEVAMNSLLRLELEVENV